MAGQLLCDLDTQQTVYVTSEGRYGGRPVPADWSQPSAGGQPLPAGWRAQGATPDSDPDAASLLWLLDYRLDHLLSPGETGCPQQMQQCWQQHTQQQQQDDQPHQQQQYQHQQQQRHQQCQQLCQQGKQRQQQQQDGGALPTRWDATNLQMVPQEPARPSPDRKSNAYCAKDAGKPPFTYTELIEQALQEEGQLTVSGIYRWITTHFGFYKSCDDRWKNSVRHNLSMNPYFRKGSKAGSGAGHLWTLAEVEGRRPRRCLAGGRQGRPPPTQPADGGGGGGGGGAEGADTAAAVTGAVPAALKLCEDTPSPAQEIWLCSSSPEDQDRSATPGPALSPSFMIQHCTYPPEVAATVEVLYQEAPADWELNNNNGGSCDDGEAETALLMTSSRNSNSQFTIDGQRMEL